MATKLVDKPIALALGAVVVTAATAGTGTVAAGYFGLTGWGAFAAGVGTDALAAGNGGLFYHPLVGERNSFGSYGRDVLSGAAGSGALRVLGKGAAWGVNKFGSSGIAAERTAFNSIGSAGEAFDPVKFSRIQAALERQGVDFITGEQGARYLRNVGAEAAYIPDLGRPGVMIFGPNPTRTQVIEELLHYGQHKSIGFGNASERIVDFEIQAQSKLLQVGPRLGWTQSEISQIQRAKAYWQTQR